MNLPPDQKFFVFDCESVGLHGQTFAVAGGIYDIEGKAVPGSEFIFDCGPHPGMAVPGREAEDMAWVEANVVTRDHAVLCATLNEVRHRFWQLWEAAKAGFPGILMFVECGWPVEARFLLECIADDPISRNWKGPYPMHEIASVMLAAGMDPMATYDRLPDEMPPHEPLADARLSARLLATAVRTLGSLSHPSPEDILCIVKESSLRPSELAEVFGCSQHTIRSVVDRPGSGLVLNDRGWVKPEV